jgi:hypothetical protein
MIWTQFAKTSSRISKNADISWPSEELFKLRIKAKEDDIKIRGAISEAALKTLDKIEKEEGKPTPLYMRKAVESPNYIFAPLKYSRCSRTLSRVGQASLPVVLKSSISLRLVI